MDLVALEAELAQVRIGEDPDAWALAAYRLAVAKGELSTRPDQLDEALSLLERASRILTAERAPLEHGRILTAAASCHRAAGRSDRAVSLFEEVAELVASRASVAEHAASLVNVGLAQAEVDRPADAVVSLDAAIDMLRAEDDDETTRLLGAALMNRAQAHQRLGSGDAIRAAIADYEAALAVLPPNYPQAGMAAHGLGSALLESGEHDSDDTVVKAAIAAFDRALGVFGPNTHPFQHAVARHSLALAYERRDSPGDLVRALNCAEAALVLFDPRLHPGQWHTAAEALARFEQGLNESHGPRSRIGHIVELLGNAESDERAALLRERLRRAANQPRPRLEAELQALSRAMVERPIAEYRVVLGSLIAVLMELPEHVLEVACESLCGAHRDVEDAVARDRALDDTVHDTLFGPQRVRMRDLLEANGWIRP